MHEFQKWHIAKATVAHRCIFDNDVIVQAVQGFEKAFKGQAVLPLKGLQKALPLKGP